MTTQNAQPVDATYDEKTPLRRKMKTAVLFSGYPNDVVEKTTSDLLKYGIKVDEVYPVDRKRGIKDAIERNDIVLIQHELGGHKETNRIREIAKAQGKEMKKDLFLISRKSSTFNALFSGTPGAAEPLVSQENVSPRPTAVPDDALENFLRDYVELSQNGLTQEQMLPHLQKYYRGKLYRVQQLGVVLGKLLRSPRCPDWFKKWREDKGATPHIAGEAPETAEPVREGAPVPAAEVPTASPVNHTEHVEELAKLYQREADELRTKVADLEAAIMNYEADSKAWAREVVRAVKTLVKKGAVESCAAFEMVSKACGIEE